MLGPARARRLAALALVVLVGCPPPPPPHGTTPMVGDAEIHDETPRPAPPRPTRAILADLEASRAAGIAGLTELARGGAERADRIVALRGLGRVGTRDAIAALMPFLDDADPEIVAAATHAIGLADAPTPADEARVLALLGASDARPRIAALDALGRFAGADSRPSIAAALADPDDAVAIAAGLALERMGRRSIALDDEARAALVAQTTAASAARRYAATLALARAHTPNGDDAAQALRARLADEDPAIRAEAAIGCGRRGLREDPALLAALADPTWTVRLEAARALADAAAPPASRVAVVNAVRRGARALLASNMNPETWPELHVLEDSLRILRAHADEPAIRGLAGELLAASGEALAQRAPPLSASRIHCAAAALVARAERDLAALAACGGRREIGMTPALRDALLLEALGEGLGGGAEALAPFLVADDPRVRSAAVTAAVTLAKVELEAAKDAPRKSLPHGQGNSPDPATAPTPALAAAIAALADPSSAVVGAAAEGLTPLARDVALRPRLVAAIAPTIERARLAHASGDLELSLALVGLLRALASEEAIPLCRDLASASHEGLRDAALDCLNDLHARPPEEDPLAAPPPRVPPVDPIAVLGQTITWQVSTTRGTILIALDPAAAPLSVAAIADLSERGFYRDLAWHRVVPDFVIQGGDPEGTGWGGPGFSLPTEASWAPFDRGAVGIADAGKDSGGSQWFIMQGRAPHLEGRYTRIGAVLDGMAIVDAITTDDRILDARIVRSSP